MIKNHCAKFDDFETFKRNMMRLYDKNNQHELIKAAIIVNDVISAGILTVYEDEIILNHDNFEADFDSEMKDEVLSVEDRTKMQM